MREIFFSSMSPIKTLDAHYTYVNIRCIRLVIEWNEHSEISLRKFINNKLAMHLEDFISAEIPVKRRKGKNNYERNKKQSGK